MCERLRKGAPPNLSSYDESLANSTGPFSPGEWDPSKPPPSAKKARVSEPLLQSRSEILAHVARYARSDILERGYELLIHVVSHSDLLLSVNAMVDGAIKRLVVKPKYEHLARISELVLNCVQSTQDLGQPILEGNGLVGFELEGEPITEDWNCLDLRQDDVPTVDKSCMAGISGAYFPKLARLLPAWIRMLKQKNPAGIRNIYLVSAANAAGETSSSTTNTSALIARFIEVMWEEDEIGVIEIGSGKEYDIFRYDDNVQFVFNDLRPAIEIRRRELAALAFARHQWNGEWVSKLHLTLSLSDGVPARVSAINASLREFRPDTLHVFNVSSTAPKGSMLREKNVQFHEFDKMQMFPPKPIVDLDPEVQAIVHRMIGYKSKFQAAMQSSRNDLQTFWLRKSKKPVLAVLMVQNSDTVLDHLFFYGMNLEVSMPTGSLCAERNAVGNALASVPTLHRMNMKMVAVLGMSMGGNGAINPNNPCGACSEWIKKIAEVNPDFKIVTFTNETCELVYVKSIT